MGDIEGAECSCFPKQINNNQYACRQNQGRGEDVVSRWGKSLE
jgi:hypothetical protein